MMREFSKTGTPLVSVIMPTYNAEASILMAISSVQAQTLTDWELIVLDDASTDHTCSIVMKIAEKDNRIKTYFFEKNRGVAIVRNQGLALSRGRYIAFLDSDDSWHPQKLEKQLSNICATGAALCYTSYALVKENGSQAFPDYFVPERVDFDDLLKENVIGCSTVLASAELLKEHPFRPEFYHEDYVLWLEILREGYLAVGCVEVLTNWCYRESSRSYQKIKSMKNRWIIYRRYMKFPMMKSAYYLACYVVAGIRKYK